MHHNETKTPLIRLAKRGVMEPWKAWCIRVGSILVALLLGGLVMSIALPEGSNIFSAYGTIIEGALGKKTAIRQTIKLAVPLLGTALAHWQSSLRADLYSIAHLYRVLLVLQS